MINFKEIPLANSNDGNQDNFELFARDFFEILGYTIFDSPARGADGGSDLILKETRKGISGIDTEVLWLVSCKHFSHSGKSVTPSKENNIYDRVTSNHCDGFIGFYSTLASEGLKKMINNIPYQIFDHKKIEQHIIGNEKLRNVFLRYFPISYKKWDLLNLPYNPIKLFKFYLNHKHKNEIELLESIFLDIDNVFIALSNSESFKEFLEFKEIKLFKVENILDEMDEIFKINFSKYERSGIYELTMGIGEVYLNDFLEKRNYSSEKIISLLFSKKSMYINGTSTIILNDYKMKELEVLFSDLKIMV